LTTSQLVCVQRSIHQPIREGLSWEELWLGPDGGLIWCWERGRQKRIDDPELAKQAERGELPLLAWKGGVEKKRQDQKPLSGTLEYLATWQGFEKKRQDQKPLSGTLEYLATWQGLRGEDLNIDRNTPITLVCTRTGQAVTFTTVHPASRPGTPKDPPQPQ